MEKQITNLMVEAYLLQQNCINHGLQNPNDYHTAMYRAAQLDQPLIHLAQRRAALNPPLN